MIKQLTNKEYHANKDYIGSSSLKEWRNNPLIADEISKQREGFNPVQRFNHARQVFPKVTGNKDHSHRQRSTPTVGQVGSEKQPHHHKSHRNWPTIQHRKKELCAGYVKVHCCTDPI